MSHESEQLELRRVEAYVFRAPISVPVHTSFGVMRDRPALVVRIEDNDGAYGWGEIWCNFPSCGAEHRALLIDTVFAPRLVKRCFDSPTDATASLLQNTHTLRLQTREDGPFDQVIAGLDIALWDLWARRQGQPLHRVLDAQERTTVPVYASGINPQGAVETIERSRGEGHNAFKVKIGFEREQDRDTLLTLAAVMDDGEHLMADANQAWEVEEGLAWVACIKSNTLRWLEEPLAVDTPLADWKRLADSSPIPLAGGENFASVDAFKQAINHSVLDVLQPDICKWGGISRILPIVHHALKAGLRYCPHYLGGGIGFIASAHCLAAVGGDGLLEMDVNANPLRELLAQPFPKVRNGMLNMPSGAGLGVEPDLNAIQKYLVLYREQS